MLKQGDEFMKSQKLNDSSTSRMCANLSKAFAIVSPYRPENTEETNKKLMVQLKSDVRSIGLGFNQFVSRWESDNQAFEEESLFVAGMTKEQALRLGEKYNQVSVIVSDGKEMVEIATKDFENYKEGQVVRTFNLDTDAPEKIFNRQIGGQMFTLSEVYEVEPARASYFQNEPRRLGTLYRK